MKTFCFFTISLLIFLWSAAIAMEPPPKKLKPTNYALGPKLVKAVKARNLEAVNALLAKGAPTDIDAKYVQGSSMSLLYWACLHGQKDIVQALIRAAADVDIVDMPGWNPLFGATGYPEIVALLIEAGADVNYAFQDGGTTVLMEAVCEENPQSAALLIKAGADLYAIDKRDQTALLWAAHDVQDPSTCQLLVEKMVSIPDVDQKKRVYTFMYCMKQLYRGEYPNIRNFFKPILRAMIKEENMPRVKAEIAKIGNEEIKQHLWNRYCME